MADRVGADQLRRHALIIAGQSPPSSDVADRQDGLPFLQGNAEFGEEVPQARYECDVAPKQSLPGDVLVSVRAPVGALNVSDRVYGIGRGLAAIRPRSEELDERYLWWLMHTVRPQLSAVSVGSTYDAVTADAVGGVRVRVPTTAEQQAIADHLDAETARIDALITKRQRHVELLSERRAATVASAVSGTGLDCPRSRTDLPWLHDLPARWRTVQIRKVATMGTGHTPSRSVPEYWVDCTIPWVTTGEVAQVRDDRATTITETRERISDLGLANSAAELHPAGTVVLSRTASAGFSAILGSEMATSQDFVTWTPSDEIDAEYLLWCLRAMRADLLGRLAMGSTHKTIYMPDLEGLKVPLPTVDEQRQLVAELRRRLRNIDDTVNALNRQIELLRERRQALITAAVTGELAVA